MEPETTGVPTKSELPPETWPDLFRGIASLALIIAGFAGIYWVLGWLFRMAAKAL
jgi:hypothetical protein